MQIKTDGLIVRDLNVGEDDRIVTILTREKGIIKASARGARRVKSRFTTATRLLCYSDFTLFKGRDAYIIDNAQPIEFFLGVDKNLEGLSLAQYFAQLCAFLSPQEEPAGLFLRLMLNALSFIQNGKRPLALIKAAFELRILTMSGYMPDIVACSSCGTYESDTMFFDSMTGTILCGDCEKAAAEAPDKRTKQALSKGALAAMRHIAYSEFEKVFSFTLPQPGLSELSAAVQEYVLCQVERSFPTLEFYNSVAGGKNG